MKVLLIHPNLFAHRYVSVGIAMISAVLKKSGHTVVFFDSSRYRDDREKIGNLSERSISKMQEVLQFKTVTLPPIKRSSESVIDALYRILRDYQPELVGISATSSEFPYATEFAEIIKPYKIPVLIGGAHSTVCPEEALRPEGIDMALVGEGEEAILELMESLRSKKKRTDIRNIYFKSGNQVIANPTRPYIRHLDSLPFPDLDIFDPYHHFGAYQGRIVTYARVETGRGCPYKCSYCINQKLHEEVYKHEKKHVRHKTPERVIDELKYVDKKIHFDIVRFVDETFTACSLAWMKEFTDLFRMQINRPMIVATRPEYVTVERMETLRKAHSDIQVTMGIESGSERIRKQVLNRKMSDETIVKAYHLCHDLGFSTASFNMIGLPTESRKDFFETIRLNRKAGVHTPMLSYFYPFPGCKLRDICHKDGSLENGLHEVDYSVTSMLKLIDFPPEEVEGLKRTFVLYVKMDESDFPEIEKGEKNDTVFQNISERFKAMQGL
jgi:anaerobic magnesium-protoporphyrin IX monomethyl ester cyclase